MIDRILFGKVYSVSGGFELLKDHKVKPNIEGFLKNSKKTINSYEGWKGILLSLFRLAIRVEVTNKDNEKCTFYLDRASSVEWLNANNDKANRLSFFSSSKDIVDLFNKIFVPRETDVIFDKKIPKEIEEHIFSYLNLNELDALSKVSKNAHYNIRNSPTVEQVRKDFIENHALGPQKWRDWGFKGIKDEDIKEAEVALPWNIDKILGAADAFETTKAVKETHVLVWIPKNLTINQLQSLESNCSVVRGVSLQLGDKTAKKSGWVLMRKEGLPVVGNIPYEKLQAEVCNFANQAKLPYEVPEARIVMACVVAHFKNTSECLFSKSYTRCKESVDRIQIVLGGFGSPNLFVTSNSRYYNACTGVAPVLWLS